MATNKEKYFNFPIQLLEGFIDNDKQILENILNYAVFSHYLNLEFGDEDERIVESASFFGIHLGNKEITLERGEMLVDSISSNSPFVGINLSIFFDYYKNDKTEFEKVTLLGFIAIKSILQKKSYCKITNNFWLSRMDEKVSSIKEIYELSKPIKKYAVHYQLRKIKAELERNWKLKTVSGRGFSVSFKMSIEALTYEVLKKRKKYKDSEIKKAKDKAKSEALKRLYGTQP
jgi:hypothetical protein